jgi:hypothetical protein
MKRIIFILLLLISTTCFGQVYFSGTRQSLNIQRAEDFFARCVTAGVTLTDAQKSWYNDSIFVPLSDSGLIGATRSGDSIQAIWVLATFPNGSETVCKLNLLSDSNSITNVNSVTFTDSGAVGNGSSSYLNTNFNPTWDSSICKHASIGLGVLTQNKTYGSYLGIIGGQIDNSNRLFIRDYSSEHKDWLSVACNSAGAESTGTDTNNICHTVIRSNYTQIIKSERNSYYIASNFSISNRINVSLYICGVNGGTYSNNIITYGWITSGLSQTKSRALHNILNNSLKGRGYNVY